MLLAAAKRRRLTGKQPSNGTPYAAAAALQPAEPAGSTERNTLRTLVRDQWVANHLRREGLQGRTARTEAQRLFTTATNKAQFLQTLLETWRC